MDDDAGMGAQLHGVAEAQIVFCSMSDGEARLDCISESHGTDGWPFALVVSVPPGAEWASVAATLLGRWTREARAVELELVGGASPRRVRISDGSSTMLLDVLDIRIDAPA